MDLDEPGSGGSTPLQDEPDYEAGQKEDESGGQSPGSNSGAQSVDGGDSPSDTEQPVRQTEEGDYFSDGGEVEREEVQRDFDDDDDVEREEVMRDDYQPGSEPGSPRSSIASPPASPMSGASGPRSPTGSGPQSPAGSPPASPMSVDGSGSRPGSPMGSGPESPPSPAGSGPASPAGSGPASPAGSGPASPAGSGPGSPAGSGPGSPAGSGPGSPAGSRLGSPAGSSRGSSPRSRGSRPQSPASGRASPAGSGPGSPPGSGPQSPAGSPPQSPIQSPSSPMFSAPNSPSGSPMAPDFSSFLQDGTNSPDQPRSPASDRSRSPSPTRARSAGRSRSRSMSRSRSRSRSRSKSRSRSRSGSRSPGGSPSYSPVSPRSNASGPGSPTGSGLDDSGDERRPRKKRIISDDESDREAEPEESKKPKGSDDEESDKEIVADELIADIFGSSDEGSDFEGFDEADVEAHARKKEKKKAATAIKSDDEGEEEQADGKPEVVPELSDDENEDAVRQSAQEGFVSDFELMMERKKEERQKQRRKKGKDIDMINDNDDLIADMIGKMKVAAEEDRELNQKRQAATKKLKLLPWVMSQLQKADLQGIFLDSGILSAMCEWLAPLPDKSLPHVTIRESLLRILIEFPPISSDSLKMSGIGKAIMYLYKHPREQRHNKERAGKLINDWSRPIFHLTSNYKTLSREEREQRDYEQLPKRRKLSIEGSQTPRRDIDGALEGEAKALRPGDPGWIYRARVPAPSNKDYVVRPKSEIEYIAKKGGTKKDPTRYEKHARAFAERKKHTKSQRAVTISIEGRNMAL